MMMDFDEESFASLARKAYVTSSYLPGDSEKAFPSLRLSFEEEAAQVTDDTSNDAAIAWHLVKDTSNDEAIAWQLSEEINPSVDSDEALARQLSEELNFSESSQAMLLSADAMTTVGAKGWRDKRGGREWEESCQQLRGSYSTSDLIRALSGREDDEARQATKDAAASMRRNYARAAEEHSRGHLAFSGIVAERGRRDRAAMERLQARAADEVFMKRNPCLLDELLGQGSVQSKAPTIDLHGLRVREACDRLEATLELALENGCISLQVVTGRGAHSEKGAAKIRPAVQRLLKASKWVRDVDEMDHRGAYMIRLAKSVKRRR